MVVEALDLVDAVRQAIDAVDTAVRVAFGVSDGWTSGSSDDQSDVFWIAAAQARALAEGFNRREPARGRS